ncbi:MAG: SRPBCC family protein [Burkholderiaceae bacterium]
MADSFTESIVVLATVGDVYQIWSNFENFPRFMKYIKSVTLTGDGASHWVMDGPLGVDVEWDAVTTRMDENERLAWNSTDDSTVKTSGQVLFREVGPNETEVSVTLTYDPPAGVAGEAVAGIFANPEKRVKDDLQRFKEHVESTSRRIHTRTEAE